MMAKDMTRNEMTERRTASQVSLHKCPLVENEN